MTRDEILAAARQCISVDRAATYGDADLVYGEVARLWNAYCVPAEVDTVDVLVMMALMKIGRINNNPKHADSWVDAIGYLALAGEIATGGDNVQAG
jgi:hypothetical protein